MSAGETDDGLARLGLLASALSGRAVQVAPGRPGEPAWTDGNRIFVDTGAAPRSRLEALAVQASLLAAGSLEPGVVRRLTRRPASTRRYLALEGHRALAANEHVLPGRIRPLVDRDIAARSDSPAASLAAALGGETIPVPPPYFGAIRPRQLLACAELPATRREDVARGRHVVQAELRESEPDEIDSAADPFSSPIGGGGAVGRWLQRMLSAVRQVEGGGPPGASTATHQTRAGTRSRRAAAFSMRTAGALEEAAVERRGTKYPEWDVDRRRYRPDWCTVQEVEPEPSRTPLVASDGIGGLRRALARLGTGLDSRRRQVQGDDIDIDAAVEARVDVLAGSAADEALYVDSLRRRRDLAVLILLDISGSVAEAAATGERVHEHQRAAAAALMVALHQLGDRVALYAFHSQGRSAVQLAPVKRFDAALDGLTMRRLHGLVPGGVLEARCGDPARRRRSRGKGRDVAPPARRAVRRPGVRPRLRAEGWRGGRAPRARRGTPPGNRVPLSDHRRRHRRRRPALGVRKRGPRCDPETRTTETRGRSAVPGGAPLRGGPTLVTLDDARRSGP